MGACLSLQEQAAMSANTLTRPAEVPCPSCGVINYIEPQRSATICFSAACSGKETVCGRHQSSARGLPSAGERTEALYDADARRNTGERLKKSILLLGAGG